MEFALVLRIINIKKVGEDAEDIVREHPYEVLKVCGCVNVDVREVIEHLEEFEEGNSCCE